MTEAKQRITAHRKLQGTVVSAKMEKTIVVSVERKIQHPKYGKTYTMSKKYKAHDEDGKACVGDLVEIAETRPLSTDKRWRYLRTVRPAAEIK
ncbi:MAG: 30S ribosomal protein S17 [Patescibacteria group bacterium]